MLLLLLLSYLLVNSDECGLSAHIGATVVQSFVLVLLFVLLFLFIWLINIFCGCLSSYVWICDFQHDIYTY